MSLQYISDSRGQTTGVLIPMQEWEKLKEQYRELEDWESEVSSRDQVLNELREAVSELEQIEKGERQARPAQKLLDEL